MTEKKIRIVSCLLSLVLGVGIGAGGYGIAQICKSKPESVICADNDGMVLPDKTANHGIQLLSTRIAPTDYEQYGISPQAENAIRITGTFTPVNATNQTVDWSVAFKDANSSWATGKTVTDYVTVTPISDGSLTANVECLQAFGEQIILKCISRENNSVYATCTVDYMFRFDGYSLCVSTTPDSDKCYYNGDTIVLTPDFSQTRSGHLTLMGTSSLPCTIRQGNSIQEAVDKMASAYIKMIPTTELYNALKAAGISIPHLMEYWQKSDTDFADFFDQAWCSETNGGDETLKNTLIDALVGFNGNAYAIEVYESKDSGAKMLLSFKVKFDTSVIAGQKGGVAVQGLTLDKSEIVF